MTRALLASGLLLALAACGQPQGDWRATLRRPQPDALAIRPAAPLVIPPTLDLPPPGGASRAGETVVLGR